jgi:hypothetical protein
MELQEYMKPALENALDQIVDSALKDPVVFGMLGNVGSDDEMKGAVCLLMKNVCHERITELFPKSDQ